jgi:hypothetical protein
MHSGTERDESRSLSGNDILADPRSKHFGNHDGAICLLVILQNGHDGTGDGDGGSVERVGDTGRRAWKSVQLEVLVTSPYSPFSPRQGIHASRSYLR